MINIFTTYVPINDLFFRTLVGFFVAGNILSIVVLMTEIVGASWCGSMYMIIAMTSFFP